jgi:fatty-acyl-CoA synthase
LEQGLSVDRVDADHLALHDYARPVAGAGVKRASEFVNCGVPLSEFEVEVRSVTGELVPERHIGVIHVRAPSVMSGYFNEPEITAETLSPDGWLNTGDMGYRTAAGITISGRRKDLIIINGRNIWPQDLEQLAESQPEVHPGDALAFAVPGPNGADVAVMVVQCRERESGKRLELIGRLQGMIHADMGVDCQIDLAPLHTLPRTSSGKLSRSKARQNYIHGQRTGPNGAENMREATDRFAQGCGKGRVQLVKRFPARMARNGH